MQGLSLLRCQIVSCDLSSLKNSTKPKCKSRTNTSCSSDLTLKHLADFSTVTLFIHRQRGLQLNVEGHTTHRQKRLTQNTICLYLYLFHYVFNFTRLSGQSQAELCRQGLNL